MTYPATVPMLAPGRLVADAQAQADHLATAMRVIGSGQFILGAEVVAFEAAMAELVGVPHAVGVSSGTDALLLALMALGLRPGDQVICPSYTFFATAGAIARMGAQPVFVDVCPRRLTLTAQGVAQAITPRTRAIIPVHLFGRMAPMAELADLARTHNLALVEDVAQALGSASAAGAAGATGHLGCFSFFPSKNLGGCGDGGLVTCHDAALATKLRRLRGHGAGEPRYLHREVGGNFRLDALQAALLRLRLPAMAAALARRRAHAERYQAAFAAAGCTAAGEVAWDAHAPLETINQFVVRLPAPKLRDRVAQALAAAGVGSAVYYPLPLHLQPCFAHLGYKAGDLPHSEAAAKDSLALPIAPELSDSEIDRVAQVLTDALKSARRTKSTTTASAPPMLPPASPPSPRCSPSHSAWPAGPPALG